MPGAGGGFRAPRSEHSSILRLWHKQSREHYRHRVGASAAAATRSPEVFELGATSIAEKL